MMSDFEFNVVNVNELTPELADFIQQAQDREFGDDSMVYALPEWYLLGLLRGKPVSQVGVLQRTITINQKPLLIAGVGFLITEPEYRSRGYATLVMNEAVTFVKNKLGLPFGLLTCKPGLESLYFGMAWRTVNQPNVFVQPTGIRSCGGLIMVRECGGTSWPEGKIDFRGLPW
jgi:GNAT superfamily N-acetyltransferase